jgi:hypothetical protein
MTEEQNSGVPVSPEPVTTKTDKDGVIILDPAQVARGIVDNQPWVKEANDGAAPDTDPKFDNMSGDAVRALTEDPTAASHEDFARFDDVPGAADEITDQKFDDESGKAADAILNRERTEPSFDNVAGDAVRALEANTDPGRFDDVARKAADELRDAAINGPRADLGGDSFGNTLGVMDALRGDDKKVSNPTPDADEVEPGADVSQSKFDDVAGKAAKELLERGPSELTHPLMKVDGEPGMTPAYPEDVTPNVPATLLTPNGRKEDTGSTDPDWQKYRKEWAGADNTPVTPNDMPLSETTTEEPPQTDLKAE